MEVNEILHKYPSNRCVRNGIHSLLSRADARYKALTSFTVGLHYVTHRLLLLCRRSGSYLRQKVGHAENV